MVLRCTVVACVLGALVSCGGAAQKPGAAGPEVEEKSGSEAASSQSPETETAQGKDGKDGKKEEAAAATELPTTCAKQEEVCTPPKAFVDRLCQRSSPSVALAMFKKGTPWTRGYLTRKTKAWNASGGASDAGELEFDEEVLVLRQRSADLGGMQVSGAGGGYDAFRWNGTCVTLAKEEVTLKSPPAAKNAPVEWRLLEEPIRDAMRNNDKVNQSFRTRQKECQGATMGTVSDKCVKADRKLSDAIVEYVRGGGDLPKPEKLP